jgi:hypothetical protein
MLYDRWQQIAGELRSEVALTDLKSGSCWTFSDLQGVAERNGHPNGSVSFPCGNSVDFIFAVLQAWRRDQIVCPLEAGQIPPAIGTVPPTDFCYQRCGANDRIQ